jgi:hydrogenase maturation protein HypF
MISTQSNFAVDRSNRNLPTQDREIAEEIRVFGTVQGVGFRPTVYRLARECQLRGEICNDGRGVVILAAGNAANLEVFLQRLQQECPPLAKIEKIDRQAYKGKITATDFIITRSINTQVRTEIAPDAATCLQCQKEIFDRRSRHYRYPFTNCTHCGPRLSIIQAIPYDRANTSMAAFGMCADCAREYEDPLDRRFHAQPVACQACGPKVWLENSDGTTFTTLDDLDTVATLLKQGEIIAIKGLGGFHLACDATNETAVQKLRSRKKRYHKPFALMAKNIEIIERYCFISPQEQELLQTPAAPIVLLHKKAELNTYYPAPPHPLTSAPSHKRTLSPDTNTLGFMLPYTPLHHLILEKLDRPIILTSGNISDEPQCIDNEEARQKLSSIADYFLLHNRKIINRVDDSVVRVLEDRLQVIRRARGYAPAPIRLPDGFAEVPPILAMGSELKNTFCLLRDGQAILSQHLGDLENAAAFEAYQKTFNLYLNLFEHQPEAIAIDLHPEYLSTKLGKELAAANSLKLYPIQHHHAHIAACMVENQIPLDTSAILGVALDGLGYGEDGTLWGGEFLLADYRSFRRVAAFKPVAMLGGDRAIYQPWRNTYAHLMAAMEWDELEQSYGELDLFAFLKQQPHSVLKQMLAKRINSPLASSCGRLFDAVAAAVGIYRENCSYEGQAAIALETLAENSFSKEQNAYPFEIERRSDGLFILEPRLMWEALLRDVQAKLAKDKIAARFHLGLAKAIVKAIDILRQQHQFTQVALSGGVWQNAILLRQVSQDLSAMGLTVLTHSLVSTNDGGLSLGQAAIAAVWCK